MNVGIIGTGLIGASIGLAAHARGSTVLGYDTQAPAAHEAMRAGAIDAVAEPDHIYETCDVVVLAAHLDGTLAELDRLKQRPSSAQLVIDVASVKVPVAQAARGIANFVPTHPMAGSQRRGALAARADLFAGQTWAYVPQNEARVQAVRSFIERLGAVPVAFDAAEHDRIVALTSHLPQVLASSFAAGLHARGSYDAGKVDALCGPAARELLRLGASPFGMWREILRYNAEHIAREARLFSDALRSVADAVAEGRTDALAGLFAAANDSPARLEPVER
jgi:prephenate dehydrogenase